MPSPMPQAGPGFLDIALALSQIGDVDAMNDMIVMLEESLARDVPQVSALLQQGDVQGANRLLHGIKGFIPLFCPLTFCEEVVRVEAMSKSAESAQLTEAYGALRPHLDMLLAEVAAYLRANGL